nr:hypothetical protein [Streptomyces sp. ms191]
MLIVDVTGFLKKGVRSAGVQRQISTDHSQVVAARAKWTYDAAGRIIQRRKKRVSVGQCDLLVGHRPVRRFGEVFAGSGERPPLHIGLGDQHHRRRDDAGRGRQIVLAWWRARWNPPEAPQVT